MIKATFWRHACRIFLGILCLLGLAACIHQEEWIVPGVTSPEAFRNIKTFLRRPQPVLGRSRWAIEASGFDDQSRSFKWWIYVDDAIDEGMSDDRIIGMGSGKVISAENGVRIQIEVWQVGQVKDIPFHSIREAIRDQILQVAAGYLFIPLPAVTEPKVGPAQFYPNWKVAVPDQASLDRLRVLLSERSHDGSIEDSLLLSSHFLGLKFKNRQDEVMFQWDPLTTSVMGFGGVMVSSWIGNALTNDPQNIGYLALPALAFPFVFFHINGPYGYPDYPFEDDTGWLSRTSVKKWSLATGVSWHPQSGNFGLDGSYWWDQLGLEGHWQNRPNGSRVLILPAFQFARNDFFAFSISAGYGAMEGAAGLGIGYKAQWFYQPLHGFYDLSCITTLRREIDTTHSVGMGWLNGEWEYQLMTQWARKSNQPDVISDWSLRWVRWF
jgi:hypothetical protein